VYCVIGRWKTGRESGYWFGQKELGQVLLTRPELGGEGTLLDHPMIFGLPPKATGFKQRWSECSHGLSLVDAAQQCDYVLIDKACNMLIT
jgi:hypothetical protein